MLIVGLLGVAVLVGIAGSIAMLASLLGEHAEHDDGMPMRRATLGERLRERVVLRWDTTRRLG